MTKANPTLIKTIAALKEEQQRLILAAADTTSLPPSSALARISQLEDAIFGLEHLRDHQTSRRRKDS